MKQWHEKRDLSWAKLHETWFTSLSHLELGAVDLAVGLAMMVIANQRGRRPDGSGWVVAADGSPVSVEALARHAHATPGQVRHAIEALRLATTVELRGGVVVFPNLKKWQEDPSTERHRQKAAREAAAAGSSPGTVGEPPVKFTPAEREIHAQTSDVRGSEDQKEEKEVATGAVASAVAPAAPAESVVVYDEEPALAGEAPPKGARFAFVPRASIEAVLEHYRKHHPRARPGAAERQLVAERLAEGYTVDDLKLAIDGNTLTPFNAGKNEHGRKYQGIELIFRSADKVTQFIELAQQARERPQRGPPQRPASHAVTCACRTCCAWRDQRAAG